ncbi:MAG: c-type cytochrome [Deltaproteobacteria bacterium]|nr:c-type cytochrome [Deltaproteobacteria bacterium]
MPPDRSIRPADLGTAKLLWVFAVLSLLLTGALAVVPARSGDREWRRIQQRYDALAATKHLEPIPIAIQQIWRPEFGVVDRCPTCHLGMGGADPIPSDPLFREHPPIPHDPREFGCTVCHAGQGRATNAAGAHGKVRHWDAPLLERATVEAGCGGCHSHFPIPSPERAGRGRALALSNGCGDCHRIDGRGGGAGPDLSTVGARQWRSDWHTHHIERSAEAAASGDARWRAGFAPLADDDVPLIEDYLRTLVGAPRLMEGKTLAHSLGCRGCHRIGGVGGDDGPDLSNEGGRLAADLDFTHVRGRRTLRGWLVSHFLDPRRVVPDSQMPNLDLGPEQAEALTVYMLSLRTHQIPESAAPRDRVRGMRLGIREFPADGESLFGVFCSGCHGERGGGRGIVVPGRADRAQLAGPAISNPELLFVAEDAFLRRTLVDGRPGRRMPAWGTKDGGLRPEEIDALVRWLRSLQPTAPPFEEVMAAPEDPELGRTLFGRDCSPCHGEGGAGTVLGPPLAAEDNLAVQSENAIYGTLATGVAGTAMRPFGRYDGRSLRAVIGAVRGLAATSARRTGWAPGRGDAGRGSRLFGETCARCHGASGSGSGLQGPALGIPAFLAAATDGYLVATIIRGRPGTPMPTFGSPGRDNPALSPGDVADLVAFLRSLQTRPR